MTGGARRIGRALSLALAGAGARVCVHHGHSPQEAEETVAEIASRGVEACAVQADLLAPLEAATTVLREATERLGPVDILINSAAIFEPGTLEQTGEDLWDRHHTINLKAPFFLSQAFAASLRSHGDDRRGDVVNILDWRAARPQAEYMAYSTSKAGLLALTRGLAQELAPAVRVNAVAPGAILPATGVSEAEFADLARGIPLGRTGGPSDVTEAVLYLLRAGFVTGELIHVSGGEHL